MRHRRAALDQEARDAAPGELLQGLLDGRKAMGVDADRDDLGAALLQGVGIGFQLLARRR